MRRRTSAIALALLLAACSEPEPPASDDASPTTDPVVDAAGPGVANDARTELEGGTTVDATESNVDGTSPAEVGPADSAPDAAPAPAVMVVAFLPHGHVASSRTP
jgi:PBP1b-binding outer membrane lipoprotein LpoB